MRLDDLGLDCGAHRHHGGRLGLYALTHLLQEGVIEKTVFGNIRDVQGRLRRQQVQRCQLLPIFLFQGHGAHRQTPIQVGNHVLQKLLGSSGRTVAALGSAHRLGECLLHGPKIGQRQLGVDHLDIGGRIDLSCDVDHVRVLVASDHVGDGIGLPDMGEKLVTQSLALGGPRHESGDIDEFDRGGHDPLGVSYVRKRLQAGIRHWHDADVGLDGAERIVFGSNPRARQGVEERRLADVR